MAAPRGRKNACAGNHVAATGLDVRGGPFFVQVGRRGSGSGSEALHPGADRHRNHVLLETLVIGDTGIAAGGARKSGTMAGSISRAALTGTFNFNVPAGRLRKSSPSSSAASTSVSAGPRRANRRLPAPGVARTYWLPASAPAELAQAVHDNLRNLGLDRLDVVNLRVMIDPMQPAEGSIEAPLAALAELQRKGLIRHIGLSNVTHAQVAEGRRLCDIVCVQNHYNLVHRRDDQLIDALARDDIAYVPFFPLGGFSPLQSETLEDIAKRLETSANQRSPPA